MRDTPRTASVLQRKTALGWVIGGVAFAVLAGLAYGRATPEPSVHVQTSPPLPASIVPPVSPTGMGRFHEPDELDAEPRADLVEVRPSKIPGAGLGLFAKVEIPADTYLGEYTGRYVTDAELRALAEVDNAYLFHIPECAATPYDGIAGDSAHYISKVNYAPAEVRGEDTYLQNVDWQVFCDAPYVQLHAIRDIEAGQELYVDYGLDYGYDFMERPEVQRFFLEVLGEDPDAEFVYEYTVP